MSDEQFKYLAEEPAAPYGGNPSLVAVLSAHQGLQSDYQLMELARGGVAKRAIVNLAKRISLSLQELSVIMQISERTLQRYSPSAIIKTEYAEKAIELARLYERGTQVFGTLDNFNSWMRTPNYALNGEAPLALLDTSIGFDLVLQSIGRIEHGVYS